MRIYEKVMCLAYSKEYTANIYSYLDTVSMADTGASMRKTLG
jgi:hypothetical protein